MKIKENLENVREFFWPMLERLEDSPIKKIQIDDCKFLDEEIDMILKYLEDNKCSEDNRRKEVESKATIFIGTFSVANTVLINLAKEFVFNSNQKDGILSTIVVFLISLTIIYLCKAIQYAIKTVKRRNYRVLGFPEFMLTEEIDKKKKIFVDLYNSIKVNQKEINIKVDYMMMAQEFFQRAVATVLVLTVVFGSSFIWNNKSVIKKIYYAIQKIIKNEQAMVAVIVITITLVVLISILFVKIHILEKRIEENSEK